MPLALERMKGHREVTKAHRNLRYSDEYGSGRLHYLLLSYAASAALDCLI
jgi:hypothetical protein